MPVPSIGACLTPSTSAGAGMPAALGCGLHDVDHVVDWPADAARILDMAGPGHRHALRRAAKRQGTCFIHLNGASSAQAQPAEKCGEGSLNPELVPEEFDP